MIGVDEVLADIARRPVDEWPGLLRARFAEDPALVVQGLAWLHAARDHVDDRDAPRLGSGSERYKLGSLLDHGATASVWQAFDRKLGRNVALKLFRGSDASTLSQILAEARAACEVQGDDVVRVLDVHDGDPPYLVMELVGERDPATGELIPGGSAATCRPRTLDEAVAWARDVARGVHEAHLRNVFHRDLKPHNVLVTPFSRRAKIADFGLALRAPAGTGVAVGHEPATRIVGTPDFMAPEQARGMRVDLDPGDRDDRDVLVGIDIWGIGAVAYELLSGRPPWCGAGELDAWEVASGGDPPPRIERTAWHGRMPPRLRRVIERALAVERHARYATAEELARELDAYLARRPTSLDRSHAVRAWLWSERNPQLALTGLLAVVLAGSTVAAYTTVRDIREQRNALSTSIEQAREENVELATRKQEIRTELVAAEANLLDQSAALERTRASLAETKLEYDTLVNAKERALRDAGAIARQLSEHLTTVRHERDAARVEQKLYQEFWTRGRGEATASARERDEAEQERDLARDQRDLALRERDAALAARMQAEKERDAARLERDRLEVVRRRLEVDLAKLATELAAASQRTTAAQTVATDEKAPP
ncbi:MAG: protein kinase [Myxococcota bacterium]|nr:protein kinase [Myxococcota bacterium]